MGRWISRLAFSEPVCLFAVPFYFYLLIMPCLLSTVTSLWAKKEHFFFGSSDLVRMKHGIRNDQSTWKGKGGKMHSPLVKGAVQTQHMEVEFKGKGGA